MEPVMMMAPATRSPATTERAKLRAPATTPVGGRVEGAAVIAPVWTATARQCSTRRAGPSSSGLRLGRTAARLRPGRSGAGGHARGAHRPDDVDEDLHGVREAPLTILRARHQVDQHPAKRRDE